MTMRHKEATMSEPYLSSDVYFTPIGWEEGQKCRCVGLAIPECEIVYIGDLSLRVLAGTGHSPPSKTGHPEVLNDP
jgi:hypothetical protein